MSKELKNKKNKQQSKTVVHFLKTLILLQSTMSEGKELSLFKSEISGFSGFCGGPSHDGRISVTYSNRR